MTESPLPPDSEAPKPRSGRWMRIGLIILAVSMVFWALLPVIPFLPFTAGKKALIGGILFVLAEITFWGGALLAGKEVVQKYQDRLNPRNWFRRPGPTSENDSDSV